MSALVRAHTHTHLGSGKSIIQTLTIMIVISRLKILDIRLSTTGAGSDRKEVWALSSFGALIQMSHPCLYDVSHKVIKSSRPEPALNLPCASPERCMEQTS